MLNLLNKKGCLRLPKLMNLWKSSKQPFTRVYQKTIFFKSKLSPAHQASAWGLVWENPKGFLISTKFRGSSSHFRFDHFYNIDFHSALTFLDWDLRIKGWVKIYNVKMVKTEMARGPLWLMRLFLKKVFFWNTLVNMLPKKFLQTKHLQKQGNCIILHTRSLGAPRPTLQALRPCDPLIMA